MEEPLALAPEVQMQMQPEAPQLEQQFPFPMQFDAMQLQLPTLVRPDGAHVYNPENSALGYWTEEEVLKLKQAVESLTAPGQTGDNVDWMKVAALVPSRSAKQCRQKWLNHLREGISKDPWSLQEEYVLARMHSKIGNKWQVLAKYLPRRPENTVKNHWSATTRAKGTARMRTLLWLYADLVVHKNNAHSPEMFNRACVAYAQLSNVPPLAMFAVSEDHFITGPGKGLAGLDSGLAAPMGISSRVPAETRIRLRHINAIQKASGQVLEKPAQAMEGYDDGLGSGEYEDGGMMGDGSASGLSMGSSAFPLFPPGGMAWPMGPFPGSFPMLPPGLTGFPTMRPGMPFMPQHFMAPGPGGFMHPQHLQGGGGGGGGRGHQHWPQAQQRQQQHRQIAEDGGDEQWEHEGCKMRNRGGGEGADAANMLLALADAANSILTDGDEEGAASRNKRSGPSCYAAEDHPQPRRQRTSDGGANMFPSSGHSPLPLQHQSLPQMEDVEKQLLARLAKEAAANLNENRPNQSQQDLLWQQLEQKLTGATIETNVCAVKMDPDGEAAAAAAMAAQHGEVDTLRRATNSSLGTEEPLALGLAHPNHHDGAVQGMHRRGSTSGTPIVAAVAVGGGGGHGEEGGATNAADAKANLASGIASPTSCTRDNKDPQAAGAGGQPSGGGEGVGAAGAMEDSVVETLGKLATDPSLSAQERVQLISSYMKAVQSFVKVAAE